MKLRLPLAALCAIAALATPAVAVAPEVNLSGRMTVEFSGVVPVVCRASVDATSVAPAAGTVNLGSLSEFCNNPAGYTVIADYSKSLVGARLIVDGQPVHFNASGSSVVTRSNLPAITSHAVSLELPKGVSSSSISFRIEPR